MTILGKHTVAETRAFGNAVQYQFEQVEKAFQTISREWQVAHPDEYIKLTADWSLAKADWKDAWSAAQTKLKLLAAANPASNSVIPAEDTYVSLRAQTAEGGRNQDASLYMTDRKVTQITGKRIDYSGQPSQLDIPDPDYDAYKTTDDAIKEGEKQVKDAAKSRTALYVGLGAAGALGLVIAAKVYL
jgi:hypothetical protein